MWDQLEHLEARDQLQAVLGVRKAINAALNGKDHSVKRSLKDLTKEAFPEEREWHEEG